MAPRMIPSGMIAEPVQGKSTPQNDADRRTKQIAFPFEQKSGFFQEKIDAAPRLLPGGKRVTSLKKWGRGSKTAVQSKFDRLGRVNNRRIQNRNRKSDSFASLLDDPTRN